MRSISWIVFAGCVTTVVYGAPSKNENGPSNSFKNGWAVLVAGSHKWSRYRHQSNVCHAYKLLRANGVPASHIITFAYDDIAYNVQNPEPGVIRNEPGSENVYEDVPIDYSGNNVNKDVFLKVLQGYTTKLQGIGSGRVVASTKNENIFIFYTGLGAHGGAVEFPDSGQDTLMYGNEFVKVFKNLHDHNAYKNILMVLESSHSGAIFGNGILPQNLGVMAITAGGADEDTWGTWCKRDFPCLAGAFSYSWLNRSTSTAKTVFDHYDVVRDSVTNTGVKEHPQVFGDWKVGNLQLSAFIGFPEDDDGLRDLGFGYVKRLPDPVSWNADVNDQFGKDLIIVTNTKKDLHTIVNDIVKSVVPTEHIRNAILRPKPINYVRDDSLKHCIRDLLSLFDKKCVNKNNDNLDTRQEDINILKQLCGATVVNIQTMSAVEAIENICA